MVEQQIRQRGVTDARVLEAMRTVPRERFVPPDAAPPGLRRRAAADRSGQTISQPYIVAYMTEALESRTDRTRSSRSAPVPDIRPRCSSELVREVYTIEIVPELARSAEAVLRH